MKFLVKVYCKDPQNNSLYLTAQESTSTVAVANRNNDSSQLWTPMMYLVDGKNRGGFILLSGTKLINAPKDDGPVELIDISDIDSNNTRATWNYEPTDTYQGYGGIQLYANSSMNLNVAGDGPYPSPTDVLAWRWNRGNAIQNMIWAFELA